MPRSVPWTYHHLDFIAERLAARKEDQTISVCLPARDEESTVGEIVTRIRKELVEAIGLVDEVLVIDDDSRDATRSRGP